MFESTRTPLKYDRLVTVAVFAVFAYLNVINGCSPVRCYAYGRAFTFFDESDEIMIINEEMLPRGFFLALLLLNILIALSVTPSATWMTRMIRVRRRATRSNSSVLQRE